MVRSTKHPFLDFFAGSGLVSIGFHDGFKTVWANDVCEKKAEIFCSNLSRSTFHLGPIESVKGADIPFAAVSWASFPCQDLSLAGNLKGLNGERSGLFWQWVRVIKEMKKSPQILIAENVLGLLTARGGEYYKAVHTELQHMGYVVGAVVLDAKYWVPQSRQRIFIVAVKAGHDVSAFVSKFPNWSHHEKLVQLKSELKDFVYWKLPKPQAKPITLEKIIDFSAPVDRARSARNLALVSKSHLKLMASFKDQGEKVFTGYRRTRDSKQKLEIRFDGLSGCIRTAKGGSSKQYVLYYSKSGELVCRYMTPREAARVMGAPDDFWLPDNLNAAYSAMGDAVAVPVSAYLATHLIKPLADAMNDR